MKDERKFQMRQICLILVIFCALNLSGCGRNKLVEGSEKTYYGIVTDCGMSVVNEGDREGRPYIIIETMEDTEICFWMDISTYSAGIGSTVTIESAMEEGTNLLVATKVTVEKTYFGFSKDDFIVEEETDTHDGFHGDGSYYLILDCSENREKALEKIKGWKELPLSSNLNFVLYGGEKEGIIYGYNLAEETKIPEIKNGYYYFYDRHSESIDSSDDANLLSRTSFNFTLAIYDSDTDRMYYLEFDT